MALNETNKKYSEYFCENIAILRTRHNLSHCEMAKILHTSVKSLKSTESGQIPNRVSVDIVFNASKRFKCKVSNLFSENLGE